MYRKHRIEPPSTETVPTGIPKRVSIVSSERYRTRPPSPETGLVGSTFVTFISSTRNRSIDSRHPNRAATIAYAPATRSSPSYSSRPVPISITGIANAAIRASTSISTTTRGRAFTVMLSLDCPGEITRDCSTMANRTVHPNPAFPSTTSSPDRTAATHEGTPPTPGMPLCERREPTRERYCARAASGSSSAVPA